MKILTTIIGSSGKMGKELIKRAPFTNIEIYAKINSKNINSLEKFLKKSHIAIDFSSPLALDTILYSAKKRQTPLILGTTGYSLEDLRKIKKTSKKIPILYSANFSLGIALLKELISLTSQFFKNSFIDIIEKHHAFKKDKPSGTALSLLNEIENKKNVNIHSIRAANIVGEHSIFFTTDEEIIEIKHRANSRSIFAKGALLAAEFIHNKKPGFYTIKDLLGEMCEKN